MLFQVTGAIGSGIVYLPYAAGSCGLILGLILIIIMGIVSAHTTVICGVILLQARNLAQKILPRKAVETFEDIGRVAWGRVGFIFVSFVNYLDLVLTVAVFMGTLASTIQDVIVNAAGENRNEDGSLNFSYEPSYGLFLLLVGACILVVFPLCCLKSMDAISKMSILGVAANVVILLCIIISACMDNPDFEANVNFMGVQAHNKTCNTKESYMDMFILADDSKPYNAESNKYVIQQKLFDFSNMWAAYGNFGFSFAVAVIAPSLIIGMKQPKSLGKVAWSSHVVITAIYCAVILISWLAWGNGLCAAIINNSADPNIAKDGERMSIKHLSVINALFMPQLWVQITAAVSLFVSIVSSVPLFFFAIAEAVEHVLKTKFPSLASGASEFMFRVVNRGVLLTIICCFNFMGASNLPAFQGLTGALTTTAMCAIIPNVIYLCVKNRFPNGHPLRNTSMVILILTGLSIVVGSATMIIGFLFDGLGLFGVDILD